MQVHIAHSAVGVKEILPGNLRVFGIYRSMSTVSRSGFTTRERIVNHFFRPKNKYIPSDGGVANRGFTIQFPRIT